MNDSANRRVVASTYVSLDGVIANPHLWMLSHTTEEGQRYALEQLFDSDALLLGRETYEGFAQAWPSMPRDEAGFADRMNSLPKYVVSTTLERADWQNSTIVAGDVVKEVTELKRRPGKDILMYGFGRLARTLLAHDLVDELRFWVHPILVGQGRVEDGDLLFRPDGAADLRLAGQTVLSSGVVILRYQPAGR
ncbi:dihydrofolate reductase family protein [Micromonospora sp. R77]|uniref:dihydrofolate reductase family protein n=1 Tax=Micromonospora sp. R77 TaxID=2925836 RepID=UPI001F6240DC|nr:dihydrofolate reductase family protein [Micromonospora sp. R77]MCI4066837.1 dihydrofolate reductase family protein [Micromonospora sp. R77]